MSILQLSYRVFKKAKKLGLYTLQKATSYRYDAALEQTLQDQVRQWLSQPVATTNEPASRPLDSFNFSDEKQFSEFQYDPHKTFIS